MAEGTAVLLAEVMVEAEVVDVSFVPLAKPVALVVLKAVSTSYIMIQVSRPQLLTLDGAGALTLEVVVLSTDMSLAGVVVDGATTRVALKCVSTDSEYITSRSRTPTLDLVRGALLEYLDVALWPATGAWSARVTAFLSTGVRAVGTTTLVA